MYLRWKLMSKLIEKDGRLFAPYPSWECWQSGYWSGGSCTHKQPGLSAELLLSESNFWQAMCDLIRKWPVSVAVHLSDSGINRRAWLGQASCFVKVGNCQDCTKHGWSFLSEVEQRSANLLAERMIAKWNLEKGIYRERSGQLEFPF